MYVYTGYTCVVMSVHIVLSDHDILSVTTSIKHIVNKKKTRSVYNFKKADWNNIREDMAAFRDQYMENKHSSNSIESDWNSF